MTTIGGRGSIIGVIMLAALAAGNATAEVNLTLRSGNGENGDPDEKVRVLDIDDRREIVPTPEEFAAVREGQPAVVSGPGSASWYHPLQADSSAGWVNLRRKKPTDALYAIPFDLPAGQIAHAELSLHYSVDNALEHVYVNERPISGSVEPGGHRLELGIFRDDLGPLLIPGATNWLYLPVRDWGVIAGLLFSAELDVTYVETGVVPNQGGDIGLTTVNIFGLPDAAAPPEVLLVDPTGAASTIEGFDTAIRSDGVVRTTFDLHDAPLGVRDVHVLSPSGDLRDLPSAFEIVDGGPPNLHLEMLGPSAYRDDLPFFVTLVVSNEGSNDVHGLPVMFDGLPADASMEISISGDPPAIPGWDRDDFAMGSDVVSHEDVSDPGAPQIAGVGRLIPELTAGETISIDIRADGVRSERAALRAWLNNPWFEGIMTAAGKLGLQPKRQDALCLATIMKGLSHTLMAKTKIDESCVMAGLGFAASTLEEQLRDDRTRVDDVGASAMSKTFALMSLYDSCGTGALGKAGAVELGSALMSDILKRVQMSVEIGTSIYDECVIPLLLQDLSADRVGSYDPNDKLSPAGAGEAHAIAEGRSVGYTIRFENLESATAPAQKVVVTDQLDTSVFDPATLRFHAVRFGNGHRSSPAARADRWTGTVDMRPEQDLLVEIETSIDREAGLVTWTLTSIDPDTGERPLDPFAGFLPPNVIPPEGQGSVTFVVRPRPGLATGTELHNDASIVFDSNEPIRTNTTLNTIDAAPPESRVVSAELDEDGDELLLAMEADDEYSGIARIDVLARIDGSRYRYLLSTTERRARVPVEAGRRYELASRARDGAANREPIPPVPDAVVEVPAAMCSPDSTPPEIEVLFPESGRCLGPTAAGEAFETRVSDACDPSAEVVGDPRVPSQHGHELITVSARDETGNLSQLPVEVVLDLVPPQLTRDLRRRMRVGPHVIREDGWLISYHDHDGVAGGVVRERLLVGECVLMDGDVYGDGDGQLNDEDLPQTREQLREVLEACADEWEVGQPVFFEAADCAGNVARTSVPALSKGASIRDARWRGGWIRRGRAVRSPR